MCVLGKPGPDGCDVELILTMPRHDAYGNGRVVCIPYKLQKQD